MPGYYIRENDLMSRAVTYREYESRTTATRAFRHLVRHAEAKGRAISYALIVVDATGAETALEVY
jgi:hypothetical protein